MAKKIIGVVCQCPIAAYLISTHIDPAYYSKDDGVSMPYSGLTSFLPAEQAAPAQADTACVNAL